MKAPAELEAQERAWEVVRTAYERRQPVSRPRARWPVAAVAGVAAAVAAFASPPGMAVLRELREAVGVERAQPALFSLPAPGRVLVSGAGGAWVVEPDGSSRRLGSYADAAWSPFGRYVVAVRENELVALEPDGDVRWRLGRRRTRLPAWGGTRTDTRIAYLAGSRLHVVGGDGRGDVDAGGLTAAAAVRPAWKPGARHVLAYADVSGRVTVYDSDAGSVDRRTTVLPRLLALEWSDDGRRLLALGARELRLYDDRGQLRKRTRLPVTAAGAAFAPGSHEVALLLADGRVLVGGRTVFAAGTPLGGLAWSPDGRWLLVSWPDADQWVFVRVRGSRQIRAVANVSPQFGAGARVAGWGPPPGAQP